MADRQIFAGSKSSRHRCGDQDVNRDVDEVIGASEEGCKRQLLDLPKQQLRCIFRQLDRRSLVSLSRVNRRLYQLVSEDILYDRVVFHSKSSLLRFNALIHVDVNDGRSMSAFSPYGSHIRYFVKTTEFVQPESEDSLLKYSRYCRDDSDSTIFGVYSYTQVDKYDGPHNMQRCGSSTHIVSEGADASHISDRGRSALSSKSSSAVPSPLRFLFDGNTSFSMQLARLESKYANYTYLELMIDILEFLPNLARVVLSEVHPHFKIPLWYSVFNDGTSTFFNKVVKGEQSMTRMEIQTLNISQQWLTKYQEKFSRVLHFKQLEIRAIKNSKVPVCLRPYHLCCFGVFDELVLENITIDTVSLGTPLEYVPLYLKKGTPQGFDVCSPVQSLILSACTVVAGNGIMRMIHSYFSRVRKLALLQIKSQYDLMLSRCFPSLQELCIDCSSNCFTVQDVVQNEYYLASSDAPAQESDTDSLVETLADVEEREWLIAPPPTTPVVMSINQGRIPPPSYNSNNKAGLITKMQEEFYSYYRIPAFHYFFHYFKFNWDRICNKNVKLKIINIRFTSVYPLQPHRYWDKQVSYMDDDQRTIQGYYSSSLRSGVTQYQHTWDHLLQESYRCALERIVELNSSLISARTINIEYPASIDPYLLNDFLNSNMFKDIPNVNLWFFLKSLSCFRSVEIYLLRNWKACTPRTRYDWELLLGPILEGRTPVKVNDADGVALYSYGFKPN